MAFSIVILIISSVMLLGFALRSRYGLPLLLMTVGIGVASVAILFQIYSTSMYSPPEYYPFRGIEMSLFRFIGRNRISTNHVQLIRNLGCLLFFAGIYLLNMLIIRNLKQKSGRWAGSVALSVAFLVFGTAYMIFYSPANAFRLYLHYHTSAEMQVPLRSGLIAVERGFRVLTLLMILTPVMLLLAETAKGKLTYFPDTVFLMAGMTLAYDALFFAMFFTGPFSQRMETVLRSGFWFFSNVVRIPAWITWFYPAFSLLLLCYIVLNTNRIFSGELVLLFRKRTLRHSIEDMNQNLKDVLHSEKNLMFSIMILANEARAAYGTPEGLEKLDRLTEITRDRMENITDSLNRIRELHLKAGPVDMRRLMDEAIAGLTLPEGVRIETRYCNYPVRCVVDEYHTRCAFSNLFSNSIEALQLSSETDKRIVVTVEASREWVSLSIRDNGPGIARNEIRRVMLPFVSTKSKSANWGIGLPYVFRIVNAQLGQMHISSRNRPDQHFTQVDILLPRERRND